MTPASSIDCPELRFPKECVDTVDTAARARAMINDGTHAVMVVLDEDREMTKL
ncbi:MAG: hypothetical protein ACXV4B_07815 [Halobacteriota archaeon]